MLVVRIRNLRGLSEHLEVRRRISLIPTAGLWVALETIDWCDQN
jgi:hypothetical protein